MFGVSQAYPFCFRVFMMMLVMFMYSRSLDNHLGHLRQVLSILRKNTLYANIEKCTYCVDNIVFLGFVVGRNGI